ncbi:hypothetical protein [Streptomyces sp. TE5632]
MVEYLVAASCVRATQGELSVSTSQVDDAGVDPVFHHIARGSGRNPGPILVGAPGRRRETGNLTLRTKDLHASALSTIPPDLDEDGEPRPDVPVGVPS